MKQKTSIRLRLLPAVLVFLVILASSSDETAQLRGTVTDQFGAAIAKVSVFVHWNTARASGPREPSKYDLVIFTDTSGSFSTKLRPGFYDVCVHARAFSPACETVAVTEGQITTYSPTLKVNQLITNEFGDPFGEDIAVPIVPLPSELPRSITPPN